MSAPDPKAVEAGISWLTSQKTRWGDLQQHQAVTIADALIAAASAYLRAPTAPQGAEPVNQCDGCRRGLVLDRDIHRNNSGFPVMGCTAHLYAAPQGAEIARELLVEAMDLVPRMSDDDPIAPALAEWLRKVRAAVTTTDTETKHCADCGIELRDRALVRCGWCATSQDMSQGWRR
jgi:hypothetical protein